MAEPHSRSNLNERLDFMGLDREARAALKKLQPLIGCAIGPALAAFYDKVRANPEARKFFADERHMTSAMALQERHWATISAADFTEDYVDKVRKIGQTHARIGLEPRLYIGGYAVVMDRLIHAIVKDRWPAFLQIGKGRPEDMAQALSSLVKAALLDMDFAISVYLETLDDRRREAEEAGREAIRQERETVAQSIGVGLARLAAKDLTYRMSGDIPEAYLKLQADFNAAIAQLEGAVQAVNGAVDAIHGGAGEIGGAADDLSRRTEQQAASLEETAAALDQITTTVKKSADGAGHARQVVAAADADAKNSARVVRQAVDSMDAIAKSAQQISQIIGVIDEIAFQTNLLALNAGVEAARAGDAGKGFAVVASEVRALAQRSAEAAKEIKGLISTSTAQVDAGVKLVAETGASLERITRQVAEINGIVGEIAAGANEQASGLQQVNTAINQMDQVTQQNAAMVEQSTAASHALTKETDKLANMIGDFSVSRENGEPLRREFRKVSPQPFAQPAKTETRARQEAKSAEPPAGRSKLRVIGAHHGDTSGWREF